MIDEGAARDLVSRWLDGQGMTSQPPEPEMVLREFEHGWLVTFRRPTAPDERPPRGGLRLIVDKEDGQVQSFPTGQPPDWTMRDYSERKRGGR